MIVPRHQKIDGGLLKLLMIISPRYGWVDPGEEDDDEIAPRATMTLSLGVSPVEKHDEVPSFCPHVKQKVKRSVKVATGGALPACDAIAIQTDQNNRTASSRE